MAKTFEQAVNEELKQDLDAAYPLWQERLIQAEAARTNWNGYFDICDAVMSDKLPTFRKLDANGVDQGVTGFTDMIIKNNPLIPAIQWKKSLVEKADIDLTVKASTGVAHESKESLQHVINFLFDKFTITRQTTSAVYEMAAYGYGVQYLGWNGDHKTSQFKRGIPNYRHVHCRNWWTDPAADKYSGWRDRRYSFERLLYDIDEAKEMFPEYADDFAETPPDQTKGDDGNMKGKAEVFLVQYKKIKKYEMIEVSYPMQIGEQVVTKSSLVIPEEYDKFIEQFQDQSGNYGDETLQQITRSEPIEVAREEWFQFFMSKQLACILDEPQHIGDTDHYSAMLGYIISDGIYPVSLVYLNAGAADAKTILLTKALYDVVANGNPITILEEGAIQNIKDFKENINSMAPYAVIAKKYLQECREAGIQPDPIRFVNKMVDSRFTVVLSELLDKHVEEMNASVNSAKGIPDFAGQSGIAVNQLQSAAMILTKTEELAYSDFVRKIAEILMRDVCEYMDYEFTIPFMNNTILTLNKNNVPTWDYEQYYIDPIVNNDPAAQEAMMKQYYQQWGSMGWLKPTTVMEKMGEGNAETLYKESPHYQNIGYIQEAMKDPKIADAIMNLIASQPTPEKEGGLTANKNKTEKTA